VYYGNVWNSQQFPFLSQFLFNGTSNATNYVVYDQTLILNEHNEIDQTKLAFEGLPYLTGTYICYLITSNAGLTATFTHMLLWNLDDIKAGWAWASPSNLKRLIGKSSWKFWQDGETPEERLARKEADPNIDPHYKIMLRNKYKECPLWWWAAVLLVSFVVGLACLYVMDSGLPWWGFIVANLLTALFMLFFGAQMGITGFQFNIQPICQMLAGYLFPGRPLANFYFTCYTYNSLQQGELLAKDIKLAQYVHLPPRCTFLVQVAGAVIGGMFNWVMMVDIVQNQAPLLTSIQGSNIWSGQNIQQFNTLAIAWAIAKDMFSVGARYQWVTLSFLIGFLVPLPFYFGHKLLGWKMFSYINCSIILWFMGNLFVGINSSILSFFIIAFFSQFYLRKYKPQLFIKVSE
jgi:OPT family oligopeptide transporter